MRSILSHDEAHRLLKDLFVRFGKRNFDNNANKKVMENALRIYQNIKDEKTHLVINSFLKICLHFKHPENCLFVLGDVEAVSDGKISYSSLLRCCIKCDDFNNGQKIHKMVKAKQHKDIFTETTLIHFYGHFGEVDEAKNIFADLPNDTKTNVTIGAMMKTLIDNGKNEEALSVFSEYGTFRDDVIYLLAIKACTKSNDERMGREVISQVQKNKIRKIELKNCLIDFFGHFGDIENAKKVFDSIQENKKTVESINCLMKAYGKCNKDKDALALFDDCCSMNLVDDISRILAIKSCQKVKDWNKGKEIHSEMGNDKTRNVLWPTWRH